MSAHRGASGARGRFTQMANDAIRDESLSPVAELVIMLVLSYPEDFRFNQDWLRERLLRRPGVTAHAIKVAMKELSTGGYYIKNRTSGGKGTWLWDQIITDTPADFAGETPAETPAGETLSSVNQFTDELTCGNVASTQVVSSVNPYMDEPVDEKELKDVEVQDLKTKDENLSLSDAPPQAERLADMLRAALPGTDGREIFFYVGRIEGLKNQGQIKTTPAAWLRTVIANGDAPDLVAGFRNGIGGKPDMWSAAMERARRRESATDGAMADAQSLHRPREQHESHCRCSVCWSDDGRPLRQVNYTDEEYRQGWGGESTGGDHAQEAYEAGLRVDAAMDRATPGRSASCRSDDHDHCTQDWCKCPCSHSGLYRYNEPSAYADSLKTQAGMTPASPYAA